MGSPFDVSYSGTHVFEAPPEVLWQELQRVEMFEGWWPWMKEVRLRGEALSPRSVISFVVDPPVPYKMDIAVAVIAAEPGRFLQGAVSGDLTGTASLGFDEVGGRTSVDVRWDVELANRRMRAGILVARPILLWAQRWAVEVALRGFRSHLERLDD